MQDSNPAALAGFQAGSAMLNNVIQRAREFGLEQQRTQSDLQTANLNRQALQEQIAMQNVQAQQAKKANFLQSFNPVPGASKRYSDTVLGQSKPVDTSNPDTQGMKDWVEFPTPSTPEGRKQFGIPEGDEGTQYPPNWRLPKDQFLQRATQGFDSTPYDQLPPEAQQHIIDEYQNNAPQGTMVSPAEAVQAYRAQQTGQLPPIDIRHMGALPTKLTIGPTGPTAEYFPGGDTATPIPSPGGGPAQFLSVRGEIKPNPQAPNQEQAMSNSQTASSLEGDLDFINKARAIVNDQKNQVVGPGLFEGREPGKIARGIGSVLNPNSPGYTSERYLMQNLQQQVLKSAKNMGGRVSGYELNFLTDSLPRQSDPPEVWNQYFDKWENLTKNTLNAVQQNTPPNLLPPVKLNYPLPPPSATANKGGSGNTGRGDGTIPGSSASSTSGGIRKFATEAQAEAAGLTPGQIVQIYDQSQGRYVSKRYTGPAK